MKHAIFAIAAPALALAACSSSDDSSENATTISGDGYELTIDGDDNDASMVITGPDGEATFESGSGVEPNLPDGWSVYPGASVQSAINVDSEGEAGTMVVMQVEADVDDVIEHYREEAEATDHEIQMELTTANARIIGGKGPDGSAFSASVAPGAEDGPVTIQLTIGKGD